MTTPPGFGPPIPIQPPYGASPAPYGGPAPAPASYPAPYPASYPAPYTLPLADGPEFVAHDRRNSVIVDPSGVSLEVNGHTMDFPWAGVSTVHFAPAPYGHVLMVSVTHPSGMLYECRIDAKRKAQLHQWLAELGPVLHHYLAGR
ncbi:hypothetical protein AMK26_09155 [Streptomyces sp. CB03234]|uniref:hypothetical protein n=1 Tax=Streptomyces sp. (strain CB03234) TaxID=1703937 RepID=UPI00093D15CE|nr:hypothetical protein [Streptomyces sp. CB03234]OKK06214.1 hypothetical protein AMK26_09155 [Streptomyces sp. CB03234]